MPGIAGYKIDGFRTRFEVGAHDIFARDKDSAWQLLTKEINTGGALQVTVKMGGDVPILREWVGDKQFGAFRELNKTIVTTPKEASMEIRRREAEDPSGVVGDRIDGFLRGNEYIRTKLVWDKLLSNPTGIDAAAILSTTHPFGSSTTWSNKTTDALSFTAYKAAKNAMRELKGESGEYLNLIPTHMFVGPDLERTAKEILNCDARPVVFTTAGVEATSGTANSAVVITNVYKGDCTLIVSNRFSNGTNDTNWLLYDSTKSCPPIGMAVLRAPEAISRVAMDDEARFMRDVYQFSIECDIGVDGLYPYALYGALG